MSEDAKRITQLEQENAQLRQRVGELKTMYWRSKELIDLLENRLQGLELDEIYACKCQRGNS
jgi:hypothetical protein